MFKTILILYKADSLRWLPEITTPILIELGTADPTVLPHMARQMYDAASASRQRDLHYITHATHYFEGQPDLLNEALDLDERLVSDTKRSSPNSTEDS